MDIIPIPAFRDNYIWLVHDGRHALVVDPGDATPVEEALRERGLTLAAILVTHHHPDHTGGIGALVDGDLLWVRLSEKRIDLLDKPAFLRGEIVAPATASFDDRGELVARRLAQIEKRQFQIAACSVLDNVSNAEFGVVPLAVNRRATLRWPVTR